MTDRTSESDAPSAVETSESGRTDGRGDVTRSQVLDHLRGETEPIALVDLSCRLVADEEDPDAEPPPHDAVQRAYLALVRYHVPALQERGLIEYERDEGTVRLAGPGSS